MAELLQAGHSSGHQPTASDHWRTTCSWAGTACCRNNVMFTWAALSVTITVFLTWRQHAVMERQEHCCGRTFYSLDALPATQPTASKHSRQWMTNMLIEYLHHSFTDFPRLLKDLVKQSEHEIFVRGKYQASMVTTKQNAQMWKDNVPATCHHSTHIGHEVGRICLTDRGPDLDLDHDRESQNQKIYFRNHLHKITINKTTTGCGKKSNPLSYFANF